MKRVGVSLLPPWVGMPILRKAAPLFQPPPPRVFYQATLRIRWYPFILLVGERHCENNLSCLRIQECSTMTQSGLEPRPFDAEFSALTVRLTVIETWKRGRYLSKLIKVLNIFFHLNSLSSTSCKCNSKSSKGRESFLPNGWPERSCITVTHIQKKEPISRY